MTLHPGLAGMLSLRGRTALVTGGAGGIGSATVELFLEAGAEVLCLDLPGKAPPDGAIGHGCDFSDPDAIADTMQRIRDSNPSLDLLVHCAGITRDKVLWKLEDADWDEVLAVNLDSAFFVLRAAAPLLRARGGGSVVFISSINGERGKFGQANYAASKAGLIALAKVAARELGHFGIRVNCISPGLIHTSMTRDLPAEALARAREEQVLEREGQPEDVARAALFLCSEMSAHVTGQVLRVDGGQWMA
ncbi:MAG: SDR family oxidoreductase [Planctomycetota bacterium]